MNDEHSGRLLIICGLPGSGKTTFAKRLECSHRAIRLCPDEWMTALSINLYNEESRAKIEACQWEFGRNLLALGHTVIIEWGTWARSERDSLRVEARRLGVAVELHYLYAPVDVLFERIQRRAMEDPPIEREHIEQWLEIFQPPTPDEIALYDNPTQISD